MFEKKLDGNLIMKQFTRKSVISICVLLILFIGLNYYFKSDKEIDYIPSGVEPSITLYGEAHGVEEYYDIELSEWEKNYQLGMRNLFIEMPYYTGQFLNMYLESENDEILYQLYDDLEGTSQHTQLFLDFFSAIKEKCPDTIFHGTDIGHQYASTGQRYLEYLKEQGLEDSYEYNKTLEVMEQGQRWYEELDCEREYREQHMVENFVNEYDKLDGEAIMGIYGGAHINVKDSDVMAGMLKAHYGDIIACKYLSNYFKENNSYKLGFSYIGLIFLILLFIPNTIFFKTISEEIKKTMEDENKKFGLLEKIGQAFVSASLLLFASNNPKVFYKPGSYIIFPDRFQWFVMAAIFMILYECYWLRYFFSKRSVTDFYYNFAGVPYAGATLPCLAAFCLGIYTGNGIIIFSAVILSIGHIGIHYTNAHKKS